MIVKAHKGLWEHVYKKNTGRHKMPGQKDFMMVDEFIDFVGNAGLLNDGLTQQKLPLIFNLSMLTQINEVDKGRHLEATPLEFMEMMCRCAEEGCYPPPPKQGEDGEMIESNMSQAERQKQHLAYKIENMLPYIYGACDKRFAATFKPNEYHIIL